MVYLDAAGEGFLLQVANFDLGLQSGFEPPQELPPGEEDPIVAMSGDDILLTFLPEAPRTAPAGVPVMTHDDLFLEADLQTPRGGRRGATAFCMSGRCFSVEALFGKTKPSAANLADVNAVLARVTVSER